MKEIETEDAKAIKKTRNAFLESLQKALKKSMQAGNLEEANKIDAAIKSIQKGHGPTEGASASGLKGKEKPPSKQLQKPLIIGVWKTTAPPGGKDVFIVRPNKTAYHSGLRRKVDGKPSISRIANSSFVGQTGQQIISS